jgi:hypothetical protein
VKPIKENVITARNTTEITRPRPRRWRARSTGFNRKLSNIASATGMNIWRAQYIEATINTSIPTTTSGKNVRDLGGTEGDPSDGSDAQAFAAAHVFDGFAPLSGLHSRPLICGVSYLYRRCAMTCSEEI